MNNLTLVLGGPGTGKTTALLDIMERELAAGVEPEEIAYVTFTRAGAQEGKARATDRFDFAESRMPYFRTIHSLAYRELAVTRSEILQGSDWAEFSDLVGERITGQTPDWSDDTDAYTSLGDKYLALVEYAGTTMRPLESIFQERGEKLDWHAVKRFADTLAYYKRERGKMLFTDLLLEYAETGEPLPVKVAIIDEAQDLTTAQWAVVERAFANVERTYVAGDDDQAIYAWSGADVARFLSLRGEQVVLGISHRLPQKVHALARYIASRISQRYVKQFVPTAREGAVSMSYLYEGIDLTEREGSWLVLTRNRYPLKGIAEYYRAFGMTYTMMGRPSVTKRDVETMHLWERARDGRQATLTASEAHALYEGLNLDPPEMDAHSVMQTAELPFARVGRGPWHEALQGIPQERRDYYASCLRRGTSLTAPPRLQLSTIHGVKGAEADHVILFTDMSHKTWKGYQTHPDAEHRVFYVGVTRAKQSLHLILPRRSTGYRLHG